MRGDGDSFVSSCYGKEALTWAQAKAVLERTPDRKRGIYHCRFCRAWHVGRRLKAVRRLGRAR